MRAVARRFLLVVSVLNGLAGLICGVLLVARPDGSFLQMGALRPIMRSWPLADVLFRDFFWIGVAMLLALGIPNLIAAVNLVRRSELQYRVALAAAVLLVVWCSFEFVYMFNVVAVGYFVVGAASVLASLLLLRQAREASG